MPVDSYYDIGGRCAAVADRPGGRLSAQPVHDVRLLPGSLSAIHKVEVTRLEGETDEEFSAAKNRLIDRAYIGPHAINQAVLFNTHPTGKLNAHERWMPSWRKAACRSAETPRIA